MKKTKYIIISALGVALIIFTQTMPGSQIGLGFVGGLMFGYGLAMLLKDGV